MHRARGVWADFETRSFEALGSIRHWLAGVVGGWLRRWSHRACKPAAPQWRPNDPSQRCAKPQPWTWIERLAGVTLEVGVGAGPEATGMAEPAAITDEGLFEQRFEEFFSESAGAAKVDWNRGGVSM